RFESDTSFDSIINFHAGSPVTRWASTAFGAGIGIGSAYADCSRFFDSSSSATSPKSTETSYFVSQVCLSLLLYALDCVWESLWIGCGRARERRSVRINPNIDGFLIQEFVSLFCMKLVVDLA
ncbi:unnamed protein product, partial [Brassica oleracea var. botrytis]